MTRRVSNGRKLPSPQRSQVKTILAGEIRRQKELRLPNLLVFVHQPIELDSMGRRHAMQIRQVLNQQKTDVLDLLLECGVLLQQQRFTTEQLGG